MISNQKKSKIVGNTVLVLTVIVLFAIAYATFTQQLRINGSASVEHANWDVHLANLRPVDGQGNVIGSITGTAKQLTAPSIKGANGTIAATGTTISDFVVTLNTPGDKISYIFDVVNNGDYNAGISSAGSIDAKGNIVTPICKVGDDETAPSAVSVCKNLKYTLKYYDNSTSQSSTSVGAYTGVASDGFNPSDPNGLAAHTTVSMILTLEYSDETGNVEALPTQNVTVSGLGFNIVYNQIGDIVGE